MCKRYSKHPVTPFDLGLKHIFGMCWFALILALIAEMIINIIDIMTLISVFTL